MSRFGTDFHVARSTGRCWSTGEPLAAGDSAVAALVERAGDEGFERVDLSLAAWESGTRPEGLFSYWRTVVPSTDTKPRMLVDDSVLMDLFERLAADDRPRRVAFRFVLALILMRKKLLRFVARADRNGQDCWLLAVRGQPGEAEREPLAVVDPHLEDSDVRELMDQLGEVLQGDL